MFLNTNRPPALRSGRTYTCARVFDSSNSDKNFYGVRTFEYGVYPSWSSAQNAGQRDGPSGPWSIQAYQTYEEAYAFMMGYDDAEFSGFPIIVEAIYRYLSKSYDYPSRYYIIPEIPPRLEGPNPPRPEEVRGWHNVIRRRNNVHSPLQSPSRTRQPDERSDPSSPSPSRRFTSSSSSASSSAQGQPPAYTPVSNLEGFNVSLNSLKLDAQESQSSSDDVFGVSSSHSPIISSTFTFRSYSSRNSTPNTPFTPPPPSRRFSLDIYMREYLKAHFKVDNNAVEEIDRLVQSITSRNPSTIEFNIPVLMSEPVEMSRSQARFFLNWALRIHCQE